MPISPVWSRQYCVATQTENGSQTFEAQGSPYHDVDAALIAVSTSADFGRHRQSHQSEGGSPSHSGKRGVCMRASYVKICTLSSGGEVNEASSTRTVHQKPHSLLRCFHSLVKELVWRAEILKTRLAKDPKNKKQRNGSGRDHRLVSLLAP